MTKTTSPAVHSALPNTALYRAMASGHLNRAGHTLRAHLEPVEGSESFQVVVRDCCPKPAVTLAVIKHNGALALQEEKYRSADFDIDTTPLAFKDALKEFAATNPALGECVTLNRFYFAVVVA